MSAYLRPIVIGEILFDIYPDGSRVIGGAPLNVAWHLKGFGFEPLLISAVGIDAAGEQALQTLKNWGIDTSGVQQLPEHPTGQAILSTTNGEQHFTVASDQAFDHINADTALAMLRETPQAALYHGTLIARAENGAQLINALRQASKAPVWLDANLRQPWYQISHVLSMIRNSRWVKLSATELDKLNTDPHDAFSESSWCKNNGIETLFVTYGAEGAATFGSNHLVDGPATGFDIVDTVGAGDAFSAVALMGMLNNWPMDLVLERAQSFAAKICSIRGGVPTTKDFYASIIREWSCGC